MFPSIVMLEIPWCFIAFMQVSDESKGILLNKYAIQVNQDPLGQMGVRLTSNATTPVQVFHICRTVLLCLVYVRLAFDPVRFIEILECSHTHPLSPNLSLRSFIFYSCGRATCNLPIGDVVQQLLWRFITRVRTHGYAYMPCLKIGTYDE